MARQLKTCALFAVLAAVGCSQKDTEAPPPPRVSAPEQTLLDRVLVRGSAEYSSKIAITREPAFAATDTVPADLTADSFTAQFEVKLPLNPGLNTFHFTATDAAGNTSEVTDLKVTRVQPQLILSSKDAAGQPVKGSAITVPPGSTIEATIVGADQSPASLAWSLYSDAPGALITGAAISGVTAARAEAYKAIAVFPGQADLNGAPITVSATFTVVPGKVQTIDLTASPAKAVAGQQVQLTATAKDSFGNEVADANINLTSSPDLAPTFTIPGSTVSKNQGFVGKRTFQAYDLSGVKANGYTFDITATVANSTPALTKTISVEVQPAAAFSFKKIADPAGGTGLIDDFVFTSHCAASATSCTGLIGVPAGSDITYSYGVVDMYGNERVGPVTVVTDIPGALVLDDGVGGQGTISNLVFSRQSAYHVSAYIAGVQGSVMRTISLDPGAPASVSLNLSATLVPLKTQVTAIATVRDAFGNILACNTGSMSLAAVAIGTVANAPTAGTLACAGGMYSQAFTFHSEGTYSITATYGSGTSAVTNVAYLNAMGFDTAPPQVVVSNATPPPANAIQTVRVNGVECTSPCDVLPGDQIDFIAHATDNFALAELAYSIYFTSTGNTRSRTVLIGAGVAAKDLPFTFNIPGGATPEVAPLAVQAVDTAGNIGAAPEFLLNVVTNAVAVGGRKLSILAARNANNLLNQPSDVAVKSTGEVLIANSGGRNILQLSNGALGLYGGNGTAFNYVAIDSSDRLYLSSANGNSIQRVLTNGTFDPFVTAGPGRFEGLAMLPSTQQRGTVHLGNTLNPVLDGNALTIDGGTATAWTFQMQGPGGACTANATRSCVSFTSQTDVAQALAAAINGNTTVRVTATATAAGVNPPIVSLESKNAGEPSALYPAVTVAGSGRITATMAEGHNEELYSGNSFDMNIYRWTESGNPFTLAGAHGFFSMNDIGAGFGDSHLGIAVRDIWAPPTDANFDSMFYFVPLNQPNELWAFRSRGANSLGGGANASTLHFRLAGGGGNNFGNLIDVALTKTNCLLVSDDNQNGNNTGTIYAINVGDPLATAPTVTLLARGLNRPRGITVDGQGNLIIADQNPDVIYKLSPANPLPPGACF